LTHSLTTKHAVSLVEGITKVTKKVFFVFYVFFVVKILFAFFLRLRVL